MRTPRVLLALAVIPGVLFVGCSASGAPSSLRIISVTIEPPTIEPGGACVLTVIADPVDGLTYSYRVIAGGGEVTGNGPTATYTADEDAQHNTTVTVRCTVTNAAGASASYDARIVVVHADVPAPSTTGLLMVRVAEPDGSPIEGAVLTFGGVGASANELGWAVLRDLGPVSAGMLRATAEGHVPSVKPVDIVAGEPTSLSVALAPVGTSLTSAMGEDVPVTHNGGGAVIPAHSLVDGLGRPASTVAATATTLLPTDDGYNSVVPGVFVGRRASDGVLVPIRTYGLVRVTVADGLGNSLRLAQGQMARLTIPVSTSFDPGAESVPLWRFDEETEEWVEEGSLPRDPTGTAYTGPVARLGTWCLGYSYSGALERVAVTDGAGEAMAAALVVAANMGWRSIDYTDESGVAAVLCPPGETCGIWAQRGPVSSSARETITPAAGQTGETAITFLAPRAEIILTWGDEPADLVSHLFCAVDPEDWSGWVPVTQYEVTRGREGSVTRPPWAALSADDEDGFGPQILSISRLVPGTYRYVVENVTGQAVSPIEHSGADVTLCLPGGSIRDWSAPGVNPDTARNAYWLVFDLVVDEAGGIAVVSRNQYAATDGDATP